MEVEISDRSLEHLSEEAVREFRRVVKRHTDDLLKEAARLEAAYRTGQNPEITAQHIRDASRLPGRRLRLGRVLSVVVSYVGSYAATFSIGISYTELGKSDWAPIVFAFSVLGGIILATITIVGTLYWVRN